MSVNQISVEPFKHMLSIGKLDTKEYQLDGVNWMLERETSEQIKGGILADEMGLGKTIQMLGTILCNIQRHTLIVLPVALLEQWYNTIYYFTGHRAHLFHGTRRTSDLTTFPVVLTTYNLVNTIPIQNIRWDRVIFDEAHHLRNPKTNINKSVSTLSRNITWLITGTPIQNRTRDIKTLFEILKVKMERNSDIHMLCAEYLLKRTKESTNIRLPEVHFHNIGVDWKNSAELASAMHMQLSFNVVPTNLSDSSYNRWVSGITGTSRLPLYTKCKQMCVMPSLMKVSSEEYDELADGLSNTEKVDTVVEHILNSSPDVKKLVFCNFRKEMDYLQMRCSDRHVSIIDGRTSYAQKSAIFENLPEILILQVNTCCEGLNLQVYTRIYFVSPQWNPSIEDQAVARCHRIGQTQEVDVYHFKMANMSEDVNSLESYICKIQDNKRKIYI